MRNGFRDVHADIREVRTDITRLLDVTNPQGQGSITDDSEPRREVENATARRQSSRLKRTVEAAPSDPSENVNSQKRPADGALSTTSEKKKRKTAAKKNNAAKKRKVRILVSYHILYQAAISIDFILIVSSIRFYNSFLRNSVVVLRKPDLVSEPGNPLTYKLPGVTGSVTFC